MDTPQYPWIDKRLPEDYKDQLQWFGQGAYNELPADLRKDFHDAKTPENVRAILSKAVEDGRKRPYVERLIAEINESLQYQRA